MTPTHRPRQAPGRRAFDPGRDGVRSGSWSSALGCGWDRQKEIIRVAHWIPGYVVADGSDNR